MTCAGWRFTEGNEETGNERRAATFVGPEFGTGSRPDLVAAAPNAAEAGFDALVACTFNYDAHLSDFDKPKSARLAVKAINHLRDEVMEVFRVV